MTTFEDRHRQRKRKKEIELAIDKIAVFVKPQENIKILEFGSGNGYQIPYLKKLGRVVASDIYKSEEISKNYLDIEFVTCDIRDTPFTSNSFDLIFSNHVLEHIRDITAAFAELKRIGNRECLYTFTVPTSTWLLLSIPAQCYNVLRRVLNKEPKNKVVKRERGDYTKVNGWPKFLPRGHGWRKNFFDCFRSFKLENWERLFCENGFKVTERAPLLLYAPSECPVVPTTTFLVDRGVYSSALFVLKKIA